jgi:hypothetical protein
MKWERVRVGVRCEYGHDVRSGEWALFSRFGAMAVCQACALERYRLEPPRNSSSTDEDVNDPRLKQQPEGDR